MVSETAAETTTIEEAQPSPAIESSEQVSADALPKGVEGQDTKAPPQPDAGTVSQPDATGTANGEIKLEDLPTWKKLFGEPVQADAVESEADVAYRQRIQDIAESRSRSYREQMNSVRQDAERRGRDEGFEGDELRQFITRETAPFEAMHNNADYHFGSLLKEEIAHNLPQGAAERFAARDYYSKDGISTMLSDSYQDLKTERDEQWRDLMRKGELLSKEVAQQMVDDALGGLTLQHVQSRAAIEAGNEGAESGDWLPSGALGVTMTLSQIDAMPSSEWNAIGASEPDGGRARRQKILDDAHTKGR